MLNAILANITVNFSRLRLLGLLVLFAVLTAALPVVMGPGLTQAEAIGKYLDGNLPALTPGGGSELSWDTEIAYPNLAFEEPIFMQAHPREKRMYVASRLGYIETFEDREDVSTKEMLVDIRNSVAVVWDAGLMGLALHPEFGVEGSPNRNYFYVYYTAIGPDGRSGPFSCDVSCFSCYNTATWFGSYLRLSRFSLIEGTNTADPQSEQMLINIRQYNGSHRGGGMLFAEDGFLYLAIGDQARYEGAQTLNDNLEGGVLRLDVDMQGGNISHPPRRKMGVHTGNIGESSGANYFIPNDNPWMSPDSSNFEEYYAIGLRNPHRMTLDKLTGKIRIGEVGHTRKEEINLLEKEANYGWPIYEATVGPIARCATSTVGIGNLTEPEREVSRSEVACMIGGYVYRGNKHPSLYGSYLYGGCVDKRLFALDELGENTLLSTFTPEGYIMTFGEDSDGEILIGRQHESTSLFRLISRNANPAAPAKLSQTGAFKDLNTLEPNPGIIPYDMIEDFWSDGASKMRWLAIPNDGSHDTEEEQIHFSKNGNWEFPMGAVFIKHFEIGTKRLETRFEVHGEDGQYYYLTYKWNDAQTDADLLTGAVDEEVMVNGTPQTWHYPSRSECLSCHQANAGYALGPKTRYLNKSITYPKTGVEANQLFTLSHIGMLDTAIAENEVNEYPRQVLFTDASASLEEKARSYLDLNCSYCHQPGASNRAFFDARITTPLSRQLLIHGGVNSDLGISGGKVIVPGNSSQSLLYHRVNSLEEGKAMPPLAKNVKDQEAITLLENWINSLETTENLGGTGLKGSYFRDNNLSDWAFDRIDPAIEFDWENDGPADMGVEDNFSVRWEGKVESSQTGTHTFYVEADDALRLWVNKELLIDTWNTENQAEQMASIDLLANEQTAIRLEYREFTDDASINLFWSGPGIDKQIIPRENLFPISPEAPVDLGGRGLLGTYYNAIDFKTEVFQRIDPELNFDWGQGSPDTRIFANTFSITWEGNLEVSTSGTYNFYTTSDDGMRLTINGRRVIDKLVNQGSTEWEGRIDLKAGESIPIFVEFFDNGGNAQAELRWSGPSISKKIVPRSNLFPPGEASTQRSVEQCYEMVNDQLIIEAENYTTLFGGNENAQWNFWEKFPNGDASDGYAMRAAPNLGIQARNVRGPRMDYSFYVEEAGTYRLFVRSKRLLDQDGSFYVGLNGKPLTDLTGKGMGYRNEWAWEGYVDGKSLEVQIPRSGKYELNLWMREDGILVDKFLLKKETSLPESFGELESNTLDCPENLGLFSLTTFEKDAILNWSLYQEGAKTYTLQRSLDGQGFEEIADGEMAIGYDSYLDTSLHTLGASEITYRIEVKDAAGAVLETQEEKLLFSSSESFFSFLVWPNPVKDRIFFSFENPSRKRLFLRVINLQGQELANREVGEFASNGKLELSVDAWAEGIYILILSDGTAMKSQRLLISK